MNDNNSLIHDRLLAMLRCPVDGTWLSTADPNLVARLNESIAQGVLRDRQDQKVAERLDGALVSEGGKRIYPVRSGIPTLIADEAIELD